MPLVNVSIDLDLTPVALPAGQTAGGWKLQVKRVTPAETLFDQVIPDSQTEPTSVQLDAGAEGGQFTVAAFRLASDNVTPLQPPVVKGFSISGIVTVEIVSDIHIVVTPA